MHWFKVLSPLELQIQNVEKEATLPCATPTGLIRCLGHCEEHPPFLWKEVGPEMSSDLPPEVRESEIGMLSETPELVSFSFLGVSSAQSRG